MNIDISNTLNDEKNINLDLEFDFNKGQKEVGDVINKLVDKAANYVIKAMPIPDAFKDILTDIKNSVKKDGFKSILKTAVNSSIREGLEILNMPKNIIKDIITLKDVALKGGLKQAIGNAIDIIGNKYLKNNIAGAFVKDFFNNLKDYVFSKDFANKINNAFGKLKEKKEKFMDTCKNWYVSYDKKDVINMNMIAEDLKTKYNTIKNDTECERENTIIQNITKLYNEKNDKLSDIELKLCKNM